MGKHSIYTSMKTKAIALTSVLLTWNIQAEIYTYENPVDGKGYTANWKTYDAGKGSGETDNKNNTELISVTLLSPQDLIAENISVTDLASLIKKTEENIISSTKDSTEEFELLLDTTLSKDKSPQFKMASDREVSKPILQKVYDNLTTLPDIRTKEDEIKYQLHLKINKAK